LLEIKDLEYIYENITYRYDLTLQKSQIAAIMGSSGSGKSTLLDLIAGFLQPSKGKIILEGRDISRVGIEKREIAILFQNENLFEHLSVSENIKIGLKKRVNIQNILKEVGLEGFDKKSAQMLSGGEAQRVALARTLLRGSKILLLDEPFSALDEENRHKMLNLIKRLTKEKNLYTIFITHNKEDALKIADKLYYMKDHHLMLQP